MTNRQKLFWITLILAVALDQLVKLWTRHALVPSESWPYPWPGVFEIELTYNQGIAFGFLQGKGLFMAPVAIIITAGAIWHVFKNPQETKWNMFGFGMLAAGAFGNLLDRVVFQRVTDMFWFRLINFPVFNIADSCITISTIMLLLGWWAESSKRTPEAETQPAQAK